MTSRSPLGTSRPSMLVSRSFAVVLAVMLLPAVGAAAEAKQTEAAASIDKTDNVRHVANFSYTSGTDLDFHGNFVYAGQMGSEGGVRVFDVSGKKPRLVHFFQCPGSQNDVAVVRRGLIALGYHSSSCGEPGGGVRLIDVRNPKRPRLLGAVHGLPGGTHTLTVYPGEPIIYASPGGVFNGGGTQQILDVSDPRNPKVAATFQPNAPGCHDVTFHFNDERKLAFCAGLTETQIWDVEDPLEPVIIGRAISPAFFPHQAVATPDGQYLLVTDEAFAAHDCVGGPTGSVWVYDLSVPEFPMLAGHWGPQRGRSLASTGGWCTAHNLNFVPNTRIAVLSWYSGGTSVVDFDNPSAPQELAHFQPSDASAWSSYWYRGRIYVNDLARGLDVIEVTDVG